MEWFEALQSLVNEDPTYRQFGTVDAVMGVKLDDSVYIISFEAFQCTGVRLGDDYDLINTDFFLEMSADAWRAMLESIKSYGGAEAGQTLVSLDMLNGDIQQRHRRPAAGRYVLPLQPEPAAFL